MYYPLDRRLGGPQILSGRSEENMFLLLADCTVHT